MGAPYETGDGARREEERGQPVWARKGDKKKGAP